MSKLGTGKQSRSEVLPSTEGSQATRWYVTASHKLSTGRVQFLDVPAKELNDYLGNAFHAGLSEIVLIVKGSKEDIAYGNDSYLVFDYYFNDYCNGTEPVRIALPDSMSNELTELLDWTVHAVKAVHKPGSTH